MCCSLGRSDELQGEAEQFPERDLTESPEANPFRSQRESCRGGQSVHHGSHHLALNFLQAWCSSLPKGLLFPPVFCSVFLCRVCVCATHPAFISMSSAILHDLWLYLPECAMLGCLHVVGLSGCSEVHAKPPAEELLK